MADNRVQKTSDFYDFISTFFYVLTLGVSVIESDS